MPTLDNFILAIKQTPTNAGPTPEGSYDANYKGQSAQDKIKLKFDGGRVVNARKYYVGVDGDTGQGDTNDGFADYQLGDEITIKTKDQLALWTEASKKYNCDFDANESPDCEVQDVDVILTLEALPKDDRGTHVPIAIVSIIAFILAIAYALFGPNMFGDILSNDAQWKDFPLWPLLIGAIVVLLILFITSLVRTVRLNGIYDTKLLWRPSDANVYGEYSNTAEKVALIVPAGVAIVWNTVQWLLTPS